MEEGRAQRRKKKETSTTKITRSKHAMVRLQKGGMAQKKGSVLEREKGRAQRREKRETSTTKISRSKHAMVRPQKGGMAPKRIGP